MGCFRMISSYLYRYDVDDNAYIDFVWLTVILNVTKSLNSKVATTAMPIACWSKPGSGALTIGQPNLPGLRKLCDEFAALLINAG